MSMAHKTLVLFHNLDYANLICSRNIQMTALRKVEMTLARTRDNSKYVTRAAMSGHGARFPSLAERPTRRNSLDNYYWFMIYF